MKLLIQPAIKKTYRNLNNYSWNTLIDLQIFFAQNKQSDRYDKKIQLLHKKLAIPHHFPGIELQIQKYPLDLSILNQNNELFKMTEKTRLAWLEMSNAATMDGIAIHIRSAFRSIEEQAYLIRQQLSWGVHIDEIISWISPPGYSQHHTGKALDINAKVGNEHFEDTIEFNWLNINASKFGFTMPFTEKNKYGIIYEPWHWYYEDE